VGSPWWKQRMSVTLNERLPHHPQPRPDLSRREAPLIGRVNTTTNARFATEVEWKVVLKSWSSTCGNVHGFGRYMDGQMNKAEVISGLFGLITATLEDAHDGAVKAKWLISRRAGKWSG